MLVMDVGTVPPQAPVGGIRGRVLLSPKGASDADLVAQIRAGSGMAFEALDARYRAAILRDFTRAASRGTANDRELTLDDLKHVQFLREMADSLE